MKIYKVEGHVEGVNTEYDISLCFGEEEQARDFLCGLLDDCRIEIIQETYVAIGESYVGRYTMTSYTL